MRVEPAKWLRPMAIVIVVSSRVVYLRLHHESPSRLPSQRAGFMIPAREKGRLSCWIF
jgi:hypothetical protein